MTTKTDPSVVPPSPPLAPHLTVSPAVDAIAFYERAFGARALYVAKTPDETLVTHATLVLPNGGTFMVCDYFPQMSGGSCNTAKALGGTPVTIHLDLPDVDAVWDAAIAAGAGVEMPLADQFWGDRYGILNDPFGHRWSLATRKRAVNRDDIDAGARKHFG